MSSRLLCLSLLAVVAAVPVHAIDGGRQIIRDPLFRNGIKVYQLGDGSYTPPVAFTIHSPYVSPIGVPVWHLAQWSSQSSIGPTGSYTADGGYHWATADKDITIYPDGVLKTAINSINEYHNGWRADGQKWVHLLLHQEMYNVANPGALESVARMNRLDFSFDMQLLMNSRNTAPGYNPSIHAAQFVMFFSVQNRKPSAPGYGQYVWFGIPVYDDRVVSPAETCTIDPGTQNVLYSMPYSALSATSVHSGSRVAMRADLLPWVKKALQCAIPWLTSQDQENYYITSMVYGYEMTGSNVTVMKYSNLGLTLYSTGFPQPFNFNDASANAEWSLRGFGGNFISDAKWILVPTGTDPVMVSPPVRIDASRVKRIKIRAANAQNPVEYSKFKIFWENQQGGFSEARAMEVNFSNNGSWHEIIFDLSSHPNWTGTTTRIRLDPVRVGTGKAIGLDYVFFE